jgi:hypothetical protein
MKGLGQPATVEEVEGFGFDVSYGPAGFYWETAFLKELGEVE